MAGSAAVASADYDGPNHWIVEPGQTLSIIGQRTGHPWQDLCSWNRDQISDCDLIYPDQRLRLIPPEGSLATPQQQDSVGYHGQTSVQTWEQLAQCESGGDWSANTGNGFYGGVQFEQETWDSYGGGAFAIRADLASKWDQMTAAERVYRTGYGGNGPQGAGAWPVCSYEAGMR